jgi:hypothetical protein
VEDDPRVLTVRYEDLVHRYEPTLHTLCDFLELSFVAAFLAYPETAAVRQSAAWFGPAAPLSERSVGRWRNPRFRDRVDALLGDPRAVDHLRHYGYLDGGSTGAAASTAAGSGA